MSTVKKLLILPIFFFTGLLIGQSKFINKNILSLSSRNSMSIFEDVGYEELDIKLETVKKDSKNVIGGKVYVPKYWKYGLNIDNYDYLEGYVPNIRNFKEYWNIHTNIQYGYNPTDQKYSLSEIFNTFENNDISHTTTGILNESSNFSWNDSNCSNFYSTKINTQLFICDNWVNWTGNLITDKYFVLVKCSIDSKNGYCLFEDYIKAYYNNKRYGESRCFGDNDFYCSFEDYLNNISIQK